MKNKKILEQKQEEKQKNKNLKNEKISGWTEEKATNLRSGLT